MADEEEASEKPHEATPRKLQEARKRGEVPVSQDLVTFGVYSGILIAMATLGAWSVDRAGASLVPFLDTPEALAERLTDYHEKTEPVLDLFRRKELVLDIDGTALPDEIHAEIRAGIRA